MGTQHLVGVGLLACSMVANQEARAIDEPLPPVTFVEEEDLVTDNDSFANSNIIQAPTELGEDCFFITGKLQEDCVWDREFKCYIALYSKAFDAVPTDPANGALVSVEQIVKTSSIGVMVVNNFEGDAIRLAFGSIYDGFDGTINGLFSNAPHGETGQIRVEIVFIDNATPLEIKEFTFDFKTGGEALRLGCDVPPGTDSALITCFEDENQKPVCYDVDHYMITGLTPRELYCITVIGGLDDACEPTDTLLGWFDKQGNRNGGPFGLNDDAGSPYSQLCVFADDVGNLPFAVTASGDEDFNGLDDAQQEDYFVYLEDEDYLEEGFLPGENWVTGASLKDHTAESVFRLSRSDFDEQAGDGGDGYHCPPGHGVCGGYCIKIQVQLHVEGDDDDDDMGGQKPFLDPRIEGSPDLNVDGFVDALDLAMLLSQWGPMQ